MRSVQRRLGLRLRLLALVLVPVLVSSLFAWNTAADKRSEARVASEVHDRVDTLAALVDLRTVMMSARVPIEVEVRASSLGLDTTEGLKLLHLDGAKFGNLQQVERALTKLPAGDRPFSVGTLDDLQAMREADNGLGVIDLFSRLELLTDDLWSRKYDQVEAQTDTLGRPALSQALRDLNSAAFAASSMASMMTGLADYWFAVMSKSDRLEAARVALGSSAARFDRLMASLSSSSEPKVARAARAIQAKVKDGRFNAAIDDATEGRPAAPFVDGVDLDLIVATFKDSFRFVEPVLSVMNGRSTDLEASVGRFADDASRAGAISLSLAIVMVVVLPALCLLVASSFERPLRRLIAGAQRVGGGDLAVGPLPTEGPPEVAAATSAFNDVVGNLRLLERKLEALADGTVEDARMRAPLPGDLGKALEKSVQVLSDSIVERAALQDQLAHQATHDPLTGIHNRAGALEALESALARARRQRTNVALAFLDLDGFKAANDTYGHRVGDQVLQEVARRLERQARAGDACARLGGDEFVIIAENVDVDAVGVAIASRVAAAIAEPFAFDEATVSISASIGVAFAEGGREQALDVLAHADLAAYRAKRAGTGVELFDQHLEAQLAEEQRSGTDRRDRTDARAQADELELDLRR